MTAELPSGAFYGQTVRRRTIPGFLLAETRYSAGLCLPRHAHEHAYFCGVLQGHFWETCDKDRRLCRPAMLVFHAPGETHADQFEETGGHCFNLEIDPRWLERFANAPAFKRSAAHEAGSLLAGMMARLYREFRQDNTAAELAMEGLALQLLAEFLREAPEAGPQSRAPVWLQQSIAQIHDRFLERLTLEDIARSVGIHPVHLARTFRQQQDCTIGEYVRRLRINYARKRLLHSDTPLCELALLAGFSDQSHFSRTFKRFTGFSPAEYRQTFRVR